MALEQRPSPVKSPFPSIADYGYLSDCHTGALIASDGTIEWMCTPRFDSPSVFGLMLDRGAGGFRFGPYGIEVPGGRRYEPGTMVLETTWMTPSGWLVVRDALTIGPWNEADGPDGSDHTRPPDDHEAEHTLVRTATCVEGSVPLELVCEPMFEYGSTPGEWSMPDGEWHEAHVRGGEVELVLTTGVRLGLEGNRARGRHVLEEGETCFCALSYGHHDHVPRSAQEATDAIERTAHFWRQWLGAGTFPDHRFRSALQRSALTLKGLTYAPTGATVAAPTTSLPETPGGERNWDYRYTWMRDATFTLWSLHALGLDWEAEDFMQFVADAPRNDDGTLQIMYRIDGGAELPESELDHLTGYEGARPVRIGNAAYQQRQDDVFGAVLDSVYLHTKHSGNLPSRLWDVICDQVKGAQAAWREPDHGIWETRGEPHHYVSSKLMCWVALDRGARLAEIRGETGLAEEWQAEADVIRDDILEHGLDKRGVFVQHYDTEALDASVLLMGLLRFLSPDDERVRDTVLAIADELSDHGLILRYRTQDTDDGLEGEEGSFLICSFWLVSALTEIGEIERATMLMDKLLGHASQLGLYAEELEACSGKHLGNFPQAFTHLALINAAMHLVGSEEAAA